MKRIYKIGLSMVLMALLMPQSILTLHLKNRGPTEGELDQLDGEEKHEEPSMPFD
jgi:hypothetical protein